MSLQRFVPFLASLALLVTDTAHAGVRGFSLTLSECEDIAAIERHAATEEAYADAIRAYAHCVNEGQANDPRCIQEILDELQEALDLIDEQHQARLDLCQMMGGGAYAPELDPNEFSTTVDNVYFPLVPGRTLVYEAQTLGGEEERTAVTTLRETFEIEGIECVVVHDVVSIGGVKVEDTLDWYAQHASGDVWYLGEIAQNFEDGVLSDLEGSWTHGKDNAKGGTQMEAAPLVGDVYRQEFLLAEAEDVAQVVGLGVTVTVFAGTFTNCLKTDEWSPIEPDHHQFKYYAPGIGLVLEEDPVTGERNELIGIINR